MKTIWIINEGSPGHLAQSRALGQSMQKKDPSLRLVTLDVKRRLSGFQRLMLRVLMGRDGRRLPLAVLRRIVTDIELRNVKEAPGLIISSGGKSVFSAFYLSRKYNAPYVFVGERKPYPSEWFHTVFTPSDKEQGVNDILIDLIPTGVTPEKVAQAAEDYQQSDGSLWTMIIGGASRSHPYSEQDWKNLADGMNALAAKYGIRWLMTTSRRTGAGAESILKQHILPSNIADAIWWAEKPEKRMMAMLGAAERVFVTQDSVTMVTECVASGRPVTVLRPEVESFPDESFMPMYLQRMEDLGFIARSDMVQMKLVNESQRPHKGEALVSCLLAGKLVSRLN
jgi:mitochondrial fission protein ELM1